MLFDRLTEIQILPIKPLIEMNKLLVLSRMVFFIILKEVLNEKYLSGVLVGKGHKHNHEGSYYESENYRYGIGHLNL